MIRQTLLASRAIGFKPIAKFLPGHPRALLVSALLQLRFPLGSDAIGFSLAGRAGCLGDLPAGQWISITHEQFDAALVLNNVYSDFFVHRLTFRGIRV